MYKIVKSIHTYRQNQVTFSIYKKFFFKWIPCGDFPTFNDFESAEKSVIAKINTKFGGIVTIDNNIYSFSQLAL